MSHFEQNLTSNATMIPFAKPFINGKPICTFVCDETIKKEKVKNIFHDEVKHLTVKNMHSYIKYNKLTDKQIAEFKLIRRREKNRGYSKKARLRRKMLNKNSQKDEKKDSEINTNSDSLPELYDIPDLLKVRRTIKIIF